MKSQEFLKKENGKEFIIFTKVQDSSTDETCVIEFKLLCKELNELKGTTFQLSPSLRNRIIDSEEFINKYDPLFKQKIKDELTRCGEIKLVKIDDHNLWFIDDGQIFKLEILSCQNERYAKL